MPTAAESWSIEQDADHLMNDLFADVDSLLDGGHQLPTHPLRLTTRDNVGSFSIATSGDSMTATPTPTTTPKKPRTLRTRRPATARQAGRRQQQQRQQQQQPITWSTRWAAWQTRLRPHWDKVFFGLACVSLGGAILWMVRQHQTAMTPIPDGEGDSSAVVSPVLSPEDAQFAQYMLRSLQVISEQDPRPPLTAMNQGREPQASASNTASVAGNPASPQVIERIYIPVYTPPAGVGTDDVAIAPPPAPDAMPSPEASPNLDLPTPDRATRRSETVIPGFGPIPTFEPPSTWQNEPESFLDVKLVGVVESANRATALFKLGDITQRIEIGERIGESGWTLVSTEGQSATIRRNGEVRSIYVGQSF